MALQPWYKVAVPRKDLREGTPIDASEFAIHLDQVVDGRAPLDYCDPKRFFERTYITEGLLKLTTEVLRRLSGQTIGASPVINLTTPFGGGKTHALTLLYHLAKTGHSAKSFPGVKEILSKADISTIPKTAVAVFIGNQFDVYTGHGAPGEPTRMTPWGDIAWQLGGEKAFRIVAKHDETKVAPSGEVIRKILPKDKPVLILMDEVLNFMSRARMIKVDKSTLASQFYNFLENLTREASGLTRVSIVLSLPMSEQEMTREDYEDFSRLNKLSGRVDKPYELAKDVEVAEIIRRRLFEDVGPEDVRKSVAKAYASWLLKHREKIPAWFPIDQAQRRFAETYPFHPSLLSVFERKWQTLSKFQQTRGVLRMFAFWVSKAYIDGFAGAHKDPLISLGTAPFEDEFFRNAVLQQLDEPRLEAAIKADIAGKEAHAPMLDSESTDTIQKARLYQKVACTIFFESSGGQIREGATIPEIRLGVGEPDLDMSFVDTAPETLKDACYYLDGEAGRYWFSLTPTLRKLLADRRATVPDEKIDECVREEIRKVYLVGAGLERIFFPESSNQIPDRATLTLAILSPERSWDEETRAKTQSFIDTLTKEYGASARTFKSALVWAVADRATDMQDNARTLLAWKTLEEEADQLNLDDSQRRYLKEQLKSSERNLRESVWRSYKNILLLGKENKLESIDLGLVHSSAVDSKVGMVGLITSRLKQQDYLTESVSPSFLARNWPPALSEWSTQSVRNMFFSSPLFPRLSNPENLRHTIAEGVSKGYFGYAGKATDGSYVELHFDEVMSETDVEFSESIVLLQKRIAHAIKTGAAPPEPTPGEIPPPVPLEPVGEREKKEPTVIPTVTVSKLAWEGEVPPQKWTTFYTKVLSRFSMEEGLKLQVKVEVEPKKGISKQKVEETKTSLRELGLHDDVETEEDKDENNA